MKKYLIGAILLFSFIGTTQAAPKSLQLIFDDRILSLNFTLQPELLTEGVSHNIIWQGQKIPLDTDEKILANVPDIFPVETSFSPEISTKKLREFFANAAILKDSEENTVEVLINDGKIEFSGTPNYGYDIDFESLVEMINLALKTDKKYVRVPATKTYSKVVSHPALQKRGIREIVAIGESNFAGSSPERRQNILAGAEKFQGKIIKKGRMFSFNELLESVDEEDGFVKELVIKGNKTEKELGGGVCQVSTTAFRAAFHGGFPIARRRNHSYAVPYYVPYGLDAAIYLGQLDFRFRNDSPGDILIQTIVEEDDLLFVFYGTDDGRKVISEGPFISEHTPAPDPKIFLTEDLPAGEIEEVSSAHDGFRSEWIRTVLKDGKKKVGNFISQYRAWPAKIRQGKKSKTSRKVSKR